MVPLRCPPRKDFFEFFPLLEFFPGLYEDFVKTFLGSVEDVGLLGIVLFCSVIHWGSPLDFWLWYE